MRNDATATDQGAPEYCERAELRPEVLLPQRDEVGVPQNAVFYTPQFIEMLKQQLFTCSVPPGQWCRVHGYERWKP